MVGIEHLQIRMQRLVAPRLSRLPLERADLAFHFLDDVADPEKIRFCRLQLSERLFLLRPVFGNAGCFFENRSPIFGSRAEDQIDLALLHDGVGAAAYAGIGEECLDIAQTAGGLVEQILGVAIAINPAGDANVVPVHPEFASAIREGQRDFPKADRLRVYRFR